MNAAPFDKQKEEHGKKLPSSLPRLLDPVNAVDSIVVKALETSARKMGLRDTQVFSNHLKRGTSTACNYYCYNIVRELGEVLGSWSKNIKAVYACSYDDTTSGGDFCEELVSSSIIHMIIWVEQKSKALNSLLEAIDRALIQKHRQMLGLKQLVRVLDAQVINDEDVKNRTGYAALLKSIYQPPIQVWRSGPDI